MSNLYVHFFYKYNFSDIVINFVYSYYGIIEPYLTATILKVFILTDFYNIVTIHETNFIFYFSGI